MKKTLFLTTLICLFISGALFADTFAEGTANQFEIEFVTISGETNPTSGQGIVNNDYRMGVYEITNDQWNKFANSYGTVMGNPASAYDTSPYWTGINVPTNGLSWYEAAQFVNYLNTSTGHQAAYKFTGTIHTGGYNFVSWSETDNGYNASNPYRNNNAFYFLPTEDEWIKAAYWNGTNLQTYANASVSDLVSGLPDPTKWNYAPSAGSEPWNVGSGSKELNGTFDMMGNVWEWVETRVSLDLLPDDHYMRGGGYTDPWQGINSGYHSNLPSSSERGIIGFRVASVPEPATVSLLALGGLALLRKRK